MSVQNDISVILDRSKIEGIKNVYTIGCFASRVTFYSQQCRALNLVWALFETGVLKDTSKLGIIGGGLSGMTAALAANQKGCVVRLYEKSHLLMLLQNGNNTRYIHPNIYDWPKAGSHQEVTELPFLNWEAGIAKDVRNQILQEWDNLSKYITVIRNQKINSIEEVNDSLYVSSNKPFIYDQLDCVIIAVGFGIERSIPNVDFKSYWSDDPIHQPNLKAPEKSIKYLVSGCGDGGLIDTQRLLLSDFDQNEFTNEFIKNSWVQDLSLEIIEIDQKATKLLDSNAHFDIDVFIHTEYDRLDIPDELISFFKSKIRPDTSVLLNSSSNVLTSFKASTLNRFIVYLLKKCQVINYMRGKIETVAKLGEEYLVTFNDKGQLFQEKFDQIIVRHGPEGAIHELLPSHAKIPLVSPHDPTNMSLWPANFYQQIKQKSLLSQQKMNEIQKFMQEEISKDGVHTISLEKSADSVSIVVVLDKSLEGTGNHSLPGHIKNVPLKIRYDDAITPLSSYDIPRDSETLTFGTAISVLPKRIGLENAAWGSVGCFVKISSGQVGVLTTGHSMVRDGIVIGDPVFARDAFSSAVYQIGHLYRFSNPNNSTEKFLGQIDGAIVKLNLGQKFVNQIHLFDRYVSIRKTADADFDERVFKIGAASGITSGIITSNAVILKLSFGKKDVVLKNLIEIKNTEVPFSRAGDSGALIFKEDGTAIGIIVAASQKYTFAYPIKLLLNQLNCELLTEQ